MLHAIGGREGAMNEVVSCIVGIFGVQPSEAMPQPTSIVPFPFNIVGTSRRPPFTPGVPPEARA
jgi:hypothetical protein